MGEPANPNFSKNAKFKLREMYGSFCAKCGSPKKLTLDHIIPLNAGGSNKLENLQLLCLPCHDQKTREEHWARDRK